MRIAAFVAAVVLLAFATSARSTDLSDLWWNENESGWGLNVAHQGDILFLTFFIYGTDRSPYWVSSSNTQFQGSNQAGHLIFSGPLAQTNGPWFGTQPYNPASVAPQVVGNVTFTATSVTTATLSYTINNTSVQKQLTRLTFRGNPAINGNYFGGIVSDITGCTVSSSNGHLEGQLLVAVTGGQSNTQIVLQGTNGTCTMSGPYGQDGRMGHIQGSTSCTTGVNGTVDIFEIEANSQGLTARLQGTYTNGCRESGRFGGVRR